jgi:hypothetical protein
MRRRAAPHRVRFSHAQSQKKHGAEPARGGQVRLAEGRLGPLNDNFNEKATFHFAVA